MDFFDWLSVFAALVAVVTAPTALQMFFGRPSVEVAPTSKLTTEGGYLLRIRVANRPVSNRLLILLGVRREVAYVTMRLRVLNEAGKQVHFGTLPNPEAFAPTGTSAVPYTIFDTSESSITFGSEKKATKLAPGTYDVVLELRTGERLNSTGLRLVVTSNPADSYWADR